ncbi:hypothetical protein STEG23_007253, partial [Scotinomys teguina]
GKCPGKFDEDLEIQVRSPWSYREPLIIEMALKPEGANMPCNQKKTCQILKFLAYNTVNGKMEMDVEGVSPRPEPIPRSQGAGGACQAPPQPPQPQPQPQQQLAQDEVPSESAGAEDSDDLEARPNGERGESKETVMAHVGSQGEC